VLIRQINEVMKKEASVIREMGSFPEQEQVQFWHEEFMPLWAEFLRIAQRNDTPELIYCFIRDSRARRLHVTVTCSRRSSAWLGLSRTLRAFLARPSAFGPGVE